MKSEILDNLKRFLSFLLRRTPSGEDRATCSALFRKKYHNFQEMLDSNSELLKIISDVELKLSGAQVFGMSYLRSQATRGLFHAIRMITSFEKLSGTTQPVLHGLISAIQTNINISLSVRKNDGEAPNVLLLSSISDEQLDVVGGKCFNLAQVVRVPGCVVPEGFVITTTSFENFVGHNDLWSEIRRIKLGIDNEKFETIEFCSEQIQAVILNAHVPDFLEREILRQFDLMAGRCGATPDCFRVAVRSSAIGEDGELSYAGQYVSMLNVPREKLLFSYKCVVASLYTPRALAYRIHNGIVDDSIAMAVGVVQMVSAAASGVAYSVNPVTGSTNAILINSCYGLGTSVVDGTIVPDKVIVARSSLSIVETVVGRQQYKQMSTPGHGLVSEAISNDESARLSISAEQTLAIVHNVLAMEDHFKGPQDVEWAIDPSGVLYILQARPLHVPNSSIVVPSGMPDVEQRSVLVAGGESAFPGIAYGRVHHVKEEADLLSLARGSILVAKHTSPKFMVVMDRVAAILCEAGSITGHMASLSREFKIPTILGIHPLFDVLPNGQDVTVDAFRNQVLRGHIDELTSFVVPKTINFSHTPVFKVLSSISSYIVPLNLHDHTSASFSAGNCKSLHDIARFLHERSYMEMFKISDGVSGDDCGSVKLKAQTGLDLHIIDIGGGLSPHFARGKYATPHDIASKPFASLVAGLILDQDQLTAPRPVQVNGLLSVMGQQLLDGANSKGQRFGDKSYAIISDKYINFSSRVGYHYGVLDCYCGKSVNKNYITFSFKGGAADRVKRERRVRAISLILQHFGFHVDVSGDRIVGRFQKYNEETIVDRLWYMGKLLQFTRQTDMLMIDEGSVQALASAFISGQYVLMNINQQTDHSIDKYTN